MIYARVGLPILKEKVEMGKENQILWIPKKKMILKK
jgi:hypothetical protein